MWRLAVVTMAMVLPSVMTGCQPKESDSGPSEARATSSYEAWQPEYGEVRPATKADLEKLRERVHELNASSYTAFLDSLGAEIASTPEHVRVRLGQGGSGEFDLHLDPDRLATDDPRPYVVCFAAQASCVEVGPDASARGAPHLFNNSVDSAVAMLAGIVGAQSSLVDDLSVRGASYAEIDSPMGTLDCLVSGGNAEEQANLEGQRVDLSPDPVIAGNQPPPVFTVCVDRHGLVIVVPSLLTPIAPYSSFEFGVPVGTDEHSAPVPYGEASTPSSTPTETDPDEPQQVLVARGTITVGESLRSAMADGKLYLDLVPGASALPGALGTVTGLEDRVALVEVSAGTQITEDEFGLPSRADLQTLGVTPALYKAVRQTVSGNSYGTSPGTAPAEREMLVLTYRFVNRCQAVAGGTTNWRLAAIDDVSDDSPSYDQALELNAYLETYWCPAVLG